MSGSDDATTGTDDAGSGGATRVVVVALAVGGLAVAGEAVARLVGVPSVYAFVAAFAVAMPAFTLGTVDRTLSVDSATYWARDPRTLTGDALASSLGAAVTGVLAGVALDAARVGGSVQIGVVAGAAFGGGSLAFYWRTRAVA